MTSTSVHILVIEDDPDIARLLRLDLEDAGYRVTHASSVLTGLSRIREHEPHLVLLDLGLPDGDGRDVVTSLRRSSQVPIIVLTARDRVGEKVELLTLGANDYVVKPFELPELLARIAVQLRQDVEVFHQVGALEWHPKQGGVTYRGQELRLSPKELEVLTLLMQHPGRVYGQQELIQTLWPQSTLALDRHVVDGYLSSLRAKLREIGASGLLRSAGGSGYVLRRPAAAADIGA